MELPSYFRRYLEAIQPTRAARERAAQLHRTLTGRLAGDRHFADWYGGTFLYGSYRRNTALQPPKDVDVCVLLEIDRHDHTARAVVERLRRVLERMGYADKTALQRRSIRIEMSGTTIDVVPVVAPGGADAGLWIPDRTLARWVPTHPKGHLAAATRLNAASGGRYIPFVKIVKAWYCHQLRELRGVERPKPKGFTLEALVARYQDVDAPSYADAFVNFLANLHHATGSAMARGEFPDVPDPGLPGETVKVRLTPAEVKAFGTLVAETLSAAKVALAEEDRAASAAAWRAILGPKFPVLPDTKSASTITQLDLEEEEGALDEEITGIELSAAPTVTGLTLEVGVADRHDGPIRQRYPSDSRTLGKGRWLRFTIARGPATAGCTIRWTVNNHGVEARAAGQLTHTREGSSTTNWESTAYRGSHTMTCEVIRAGIVIARRKHVVNVKR